MGSSRTEAAMSSAHAAAVGRTFTRNMIVAGARPTQFSGREFERRLSGAVERLVHRSILEVSRRGVIECSERRVVVECRFAGGRDGWCQVAREARHFIGNSV